VLVCVIFFLIPGMSMAACDVEASSSTRPGLGWAGLCCVGFSFLMWLRFGLEVEIWLGCDALI
jgi:hypothetical protein